MPLHEIKVNARNEVGVGNHKGNVITTRAKAYKLPKKCSTRRNVKYIQRVAADCGAPVSTEIDHRSSLLHIQR